MFEFDQYDQRRHEARPSQPSAGYEPLTAASVKRLSLLAWGEHCVECAAPECFRTCDLYEARPDGRCRRFSFGMYRNANFPSMRDFGAEIHFKKWAKLEARGNTLMLSRRMVFLIEKISACLSLALNRIGFIAFRCTRDARWSHLSHVVWERLTRWLHDCTQPGTRPDAFLFESYNPSTTTLTLHLAITPSERPNLGTQGMRSASLPYLTSWHLPPGYSRHLVESKWLGSIINHGSPFDISLTPEAETAAKIIVLSADFVCFQNPSLLSDPQKKVKCVIWDLDETLWQGILIENDDVQLKEGILELLRELDCRGILMSIASKNDPVQAMHKLREFGLAEYFLTPQFNWAPKSQSIRRIAESLNLGLDSLVLVDDSPFELEEVSQALPEVTCFCSTLVKEMWTDSRFSGGQSKESKSRRLSYLQALEREKLQSQFQGNYASFLASCEIKLQIHPFVPADLERISELVQRTNQLNFSGRKYSRDQLMMILENDQVEKLVLECSDKFGAYGTIGFCLVTRGPRQLHVEDLMISCRVQGKCIEQALFVHLVADVQTDVDKLVVTFRETARNGPAKSVLESLGFVLDTEEGILRLPSSTLECDFIQIIPQLLAAKSQ